MKNKKVIVKMGLSTTTKISIVGYSMISVILGGATLATILVINEEAKSIFKYTKNDFGEYIAEGTIKYEKLKGCIFIQIENSVSNTNEFYICRKSGVSYINVLNNKKVYENYSGDENRKIVNEIPVGDYLYGYNNVKEEYTPSEVENLLEQIKNDEKEEEKTLVKTMLNENDVTIVGRI